jgi:hypothetical protein
MDGKMKLLAWSFYINTPIKPRKEELEMRQSDIWFYTSFKQAQAVYKRELELGRWFVSTPFKVPCGWAITVLY